MLPYTMEQESVTRPNKTSVHAHEFHVQIRRGGGGGGGDRGLGTPPGKSQVANHKVGKEAKNRYLMRHLAQLVGGTSFSLYG